MKNHIPDYFIALVKQHAGLLNDDQTKRVVLAVGQTIESSLTAAQANRFFAAVPKYLRPAHQSFFASVGNWQRPISSKSPIDQLVVRLNLTGAEEAEVIYRAYFGAIRILSDQDTALKLARSLPTDLSRLYTHSKGV